jgi:ubiquinone/menaquinone biosynthesis C-methylase UbiE
MKEDSMVEPDEAQLSGLRDVEALIRQLGDTSDPAVRTAVCDALVEMGTPAVKPLIRALRVHGDEVREAVSDVMHRMDETLFQSLILRFEAQEVVLEEFYCQGFILDVGGGGAGVIGRWKGPQVVAIDRSRRELEEAPDGPLKVVMDARDLQFLDDTFSVATAFFSFMYMDAPDHEPVLREVLRTLQPGGRLLIWEAVIPSGPRDEKELLVFPLLIKLPAGDEVRTGYGILWPEEEQNLAHFTRLAEEVGFRIVRHAQTDGTLYLELQKP